MAAKYEMKDSGVMWMGEIPVNWAIKQIFQVTKPVKNKNTDLQERNLLSLSYGKIKRKSIETSEGLLPTSFDGYNIIEGGDIVLRLTDLQNDHTSLRVGRATERGIITSAYVTLRPSISISQYLYYVLHSFDIRKGFYGMGAGVRQGLNYEEAKMISAPFPPLPEQTAIASYLDSKCATIDEVVAGAKATIEEYKSWKASVIFEAVTKGLDPNVEMKDSGFQDIGDYPTHWNLLKIKQRFTIECGATPSENPENWDGDIHWIGPADMQDFGEIHSGKRSLSQKGYDSCGTSLVPSGSVILSTRAPIGKIQISAESLCTNQGCKSLVAKIENTPTRYLAYFLFGIKERLQVYGTGTTFKELSTTNLENMPLLWPPLPEQSAIASNLDAKCSAIDSIISEKQSLISELESYKKSLIFETVTGKRRVC